MASWQPHAVPYIQTGILSFATSMIPLSVSEAGILRNHRWTLPHKMPNSSEQITRNVFSSPRDRSLNVVMSFQDALLIASQPYDTGMVSGKQGLWYGGLPANATTHGHTP